MSSTGIEALCVAIAAMRARAMLWSCLALAGLVLAPMPAAALSYSAVPFDDGRCMPNCRQVIVATGTISGREVEDFQWFLQRNNGGKNLGKVLIIHSPGGNAWGGISLGSLMRRLGMTVTVAQSDGRAVTRTSGLANGLCGSACVFVLAGGVKRVVPGGSKVAVHGSRQVQTEVHDHLTGTVEKIPFNRNNFANGLAGFYRSLGVNPALATFSETIPPSAIHVLTPAELSKFRLATSVQ